MDVMRAIEGRRSIRQYRNEGLDDEAIGALLDAFRWAPSEGNIQPWDLIVVKEANIIKELAGACYDQPWVAGAPVVFVICINTNKTKSSYGQRGLALYSIQSSAAAIQNLLLAAQSLGIGTCWIGAFEEDKVLRTLDLPSWDRPVALVTAGYPDEHPQPPPRLDITAFTYEDRFGKEPRVKWKGIANILKRFARDEPE